MAKGGTHKGIELEIGGNTTGLKKALNDVDKQLNSTQTELNKVDRLLKLDPKNTELLAQKQKLLSSQIDGTKERLEKLKDSKAKADEAMKNGTEVNEKQYRELQREIAETENRLKELSKEANSFINAGEKLQSVGGKITDIGKKSLAVTGAITGLGTAATVTAATFESKMSNVAAISGATGDELDALSEKAREMGAKTKFSASESADAFSYMAMAGWKTGEMLDGIEGIMNLAAASGEDLASVSDIVTDALTAFGLKAEDSGHFADVLAKASSNANTNVSLLGESFKNVAPVAGAMGYSMEDVTTALGLMANAGVKGGEAGTSLRAVLTRLAKPTKEVQGAFDALHISTVNSDGSMKELNEFIPELQKKFSGLTEEQKGQYATMIAGKNAMSGFLSIVNAGEDDWNNLADAIANSDGTAQSMSDTLNDNLSGQLTILKSTVEGIMIDIGETLAPIIKNIVGKIQELASWFAGLNDSQKTAVVVIAAIVAAIPPLLIIIGSLISAVGTITAAVGAFNIAFLAVPLVIAAIVTAIVVLWNKCEWFRNFWTSVWEKIKEVFFGVAEFIKENWKQLAICLVNPIAGAIALLYKLNPKFKEWVDNLINSIKSWFGGMIKIGENIIEGLWNGVKNKVDWLKKMVKGVVDKIKSWFTGKDGFDTHSPSKWSEKIGKFLMQGFANGITEDMSAEEALQKKISNLKSFISDELGINDTDIKLSEAEFELWSLQNPNASDEAKSDKQISLLMSKISKQSEAVQVVNDALYESVQLTGENSKESKDYQLQLINERIELEKLNSEMQSVLEARRQMYTQGQSQSVVDYNSKLKALNKNPVTYMIKARAAENGGSTQTVNNVTQHYYGYKGTVSENNAALRKTLKNAEVALA